MADTSDARSSNKKKKEIENENLIRGLIIYEYKYNYLVLKFVLHVVETKYVTMQRVFQNLKHCI